MLHEHGIVKNWNYDTYAIPSRSPKPRAWRRRPGQGYKTRKASTWANWRVNTASLISMAGEFLRFALLNHLWAWSWGLRRD